VAKGYPHPEHICEYWRDTGDTTGDIWARNRDKVLVEVNAMYRRLTITFTEAERTALDRLAQLDTRPVKDQVRALVRAEAERRRVWLDDPESANWRGRPASELGLPWEDV
jgi:hypothetical protein